MLLPFAFRDSFRWALASFFRFFSNVFGLSYSFPSEWAGKQLVTVDRWYPSSQACSACGSINTDVKDLKIRKWKCPVCGAWHDRDLNAAKNILNAGLKKLE